MRGVAIAKLSAREWDGLKTISARRGVSIETILTLEVVNLLKREGISSPERSPVKHPADTNANQATRIVLKDCTIVVG